MLQTRGQLHQVRTVIVKLMTVTRVLGEAGGELAATGGGDDGTAPVDKALRWSRKPEEVRIGIAVTPGTRIPWP